MRSRTPYPCRRPSDTALRMRRSSVPGRIESAIQSPKALRRTLGSPSYGVKESRRIVALHSLLVWPEHPVDLPSRVIDAHPEQTLTELLARTTGITRDPVVLPRRRGVAGRALHAYRVADGGWEDVHPHAIRAT